MKLWIIYKDGIGLTRVIAEMLQDRLENHLDVSVGEANKIDPAFLIEEKPDFLIIGDVIIENNPSIEIKNWLKNFQKSSDQMQFKLKKVSGFCITTSIKARMADWEENIRNSMSFGMISPPFMYFNLNTTNLNLEEGTFNKIRIFSDSVLQIVLEEE